MQLLINVSNLIFRRVVILQRKLGREAFGVVSDPLDSAHGRAAQEQNEGKPTADAQRRRRRCRCQVDIPELFQARAPLRVHDQLFAFHLKQGVANLFRFVLALQNQCDQPGIR